MFKQNFIIAFTLIILMTASAADAASRKFISSVSVKKQSDFRFWTKDSKPLKALADYVESVTRRGSKDFIPEKDRIAVFDLDGTLMCETDPFCLDYLMFIYRALYDPSYSPSKEDREVAAAIEEHIQAGKFKLDLWMKQGDASGNVFYGMPLEDYDAYVSGFISRPSLNFTNMKHSEAFYLPMVEVVSYLRSRKFDVYVVSGTDRQILRTLLKGIIDPSKCIGAEFEYIASGNKKDDLYYILQEGDRVCRGHFIRKNTYISKVSNIVREIGRKPVLAFGNTMGDSSMLNYAVFGNKYKSLAFCLIADDNEREFANQRLESSMKDACRRYGWIPVSMKNDFKTIYGENVRRIDPSRKIWK